MADAKPEGPFTRILVATRGAPWSERALELGVRMATAYQLELVVIAVLTPTHVPQKNAAWGIAAAPEVGEVGADV
jgi:nucleotide-binding universal stress UspA family protein